MKAVNVLKGARPMTNSEVVAVVDYRRMAERCREMATRTTRPGPLLSRAEAFEADATAIEKERRGVVL